MKEMLAHHRQGKSRFRHEADGLRLVGLGIVLLVLSAVTLTDLLSDTRIPGHFGGGSARSAARSENSDEPADSLRSGGSAYPVQKWRTKDDVQTAIDLCRSQPDALGEAPFNVRLRRGGPKDADPAGRMNDPAFQTP